MAGRYPGDAGMQKQHVIADEAAQALFDKISELDRDINKSQLEVIRNAQGIAKGIDYMARAWARREALSRELDMLAREDFAPGLPASAMAPRRERKPWHRDRPEAISVPFHYGDKKSDDGGF